MIVVNQIKKNSVIDRNMIDFTTSGNQLIITGLNIDYHSNIPFRLIIFNSDTESLIYSEYWDGKTTLAINIEQGASPSSYLLGIIGDSIYKTV